MMPSASTTNPEAREVAVHTATTLSFHLKELIHSGLVSVERQGRNLHYRPALTRMNELLSYLTDHCCQGQACVPAIRKRRASC